MSAAVSVDSEFARLIPPLSAEERCELERSVLADGCREPLVVWSAGDILLDGHNRYGICRTHDLSFDVRRLDFSDRDSAKRWMIANQLGRRNLTPESIAYLRGKLYREENKGHGGEREASGQSVQLPTTAESLAERFKVDERTIRRDAKFSEQLDELAEDLGPEFRQEVLSRDTKIARKEVAALAALPAEQRRTVVEKLIAGEAESVRDVKKQNLAAELSSKPVPSPSGRFDVIAIDPPWQYEKRAEDATHRGRNPYPDMSIEAIKALPVAERAETNCVLWLWTTNAFMREAYACLETWGFTPKTILTWVKDRMGTGDWLRGKTEHCLMAVRGTPIVLLTNQTTALQAPLREHSRKPDEFFQLVESLCPGVRLEMFAREKRDGWQAWGAEVDNFEGKRAS